MLEPRFRGQGQEVRVVPTSGISQQCSHHAHLAESTGFLRLWRRLSAQARPGSHAQGRIPGSTPYRSARYHSQWPDQGLRSTPRDAHPGQGPKPGEGELWAAPEHWSHRGSSGRRCPCPGHWPGPSKDLEPQPQAVREHSRGCMLQGARSYR